jgi:MscS family membrane protein
MLVFLGIIAMLAQFDYPVGTLLAGLGIGGIAVALAAQKTLENLIGSVAIGIDKPFRVGDAVKIDDLEGTIEEVGLRSTRIRTSERSLVSIPNGQLADMRTESFASRDRFRLSATVGLVYGTTAAQLEAIVAAIEGWFLAQPKIWQDTVYARFVGLGESALNIEIMAWFVTTDAAEYRDLRQAALLAVMRIVEENGSSFAFPTRTVVMADGAEAVGEVSGGEG